MTRLLAAVRTDVSLQARNQLYPISIGISLLLAAALAWLSTPDALVRTVPMGVLFIVGGSTLMYVVAMILLEKDDGTLDAIIVSPLRPVEYLAAKVATLTGLATLEGLLITLGTVVWLGRGGTWVWPSAAMLLLGLIGLGVMHTLIGIILVVRHQRIMEALLPMGGIATILQIPAFYFVGALPHPVALVIPSAAPCMLIRGAFTSLQPWEWAYGIGYTLLSIGVLALWTQRAFIRHITRNSVR